MVNKITDKIVAKVAADNLKTQDVEVVSDDSHKTPPEPRSYGTVPDKVTFISDYKKVRGYVGVREVRPDGIYANLVCPNGALHCIRVEQGDAVIIVRKNGEFVDMAIKGATDKAEALQAAARKFLRLIERESQPTKTTRKGRKQ